MNIPKQCGIPEEFEAGQVFAVPFPFYRDEPKDSPFWTPGTELFEYTPDPERPSFRYHGYNADGIGYMVLNVQAVVPIPGYQRRVAYVQSWVDPDGNEFGKKTLRFKGLQAFRGMLRYRKPFSMEDDTETPLTMDERIAAMKGASTQ